MSLHTNTARKKQSNKSSKVINLERTRQLQYSRFKSKIAFISMTLASFSLIVGGVVYFLVGQVQLNVLNERLLKKSKELKLKKRDNNLLKNEKKISNRNNDLNLELDDKVEIF